MGKLGVLFEVIVYIVHMWLQPQVLLQPQMQDIDKIMNYGIRLWTIVSPCNRPCYEMVPHIIYELWSRHTHILWTLSGFYL